jgi:hypothetical protein
MSPHAIGASSTTADIEAQPQVVVGALLQERFELSDLEYELHIEDSNQAWRWARERWLLYGCPQDFVEAVRLWAARVDAIRNTPAHIRAAHAAAYERALEARYNYFGWRGRQDRQGLGT